MLSIIVPAHNEADFIGPTLDRLRTSADALGEPYEIIVVADGCLDATSEIAAAAGARVEAVELRQIAAVRNAGARVACGEVLLFVDADTLVPEETLRLTLEAVRAGAVGGGARVRMEGVSGRFARLLMSVFTWTWYRLRQVGGCYLFATRPAFDRAGGFDERYFVAEEYYLSAALRKQGRFDVIGYPVTTSGRKLERHTVLQTMRVGLRIMRPSARRQRAGLEFWYGRAE